MNNTVLRQRRSLTKSQVHELRAELVRESGRFGIDDPRAHVFAACPEPDILVNNNAGPPPGRFQDWDGDAWTRAL